MITRRPALVPFRWEGHGVDLRTHIAPTGLLVHAGDLCEALEISVDAESNPATGHLIRRWPGHPHSLAEYVDDDGCPAEFYTVDQVRTIASDNPSHLTGDFLTWLDDLTSALDTAALEAIVADIVRPPSPHTAANYSVARAAQILNRDPALNYGQTTLFETMRRALGWIDRGLDGAWRPADTPVRSGWLFVQPRTVPGRKSMYPQIRITRDGLLELHQRLGGIATLTLDDTTTVPLLEV